MKGVLSDRMIAVDGHSSPTLNPVSNIFFFENHLNKNSSHSSIQTSFIDFILFSFLSSSPS